MEGVRLFSISVSNRPASGDGQLIVGRTGSLGGKKPVPG